VLVISGGSGGGFSLPVIEEALKSQKHGHGKVINVVFATQSVHVVGWYRDEVESLISVYGTEISLSIHITSVTDFAFGKAIGDTKRHSHHIPSESKTLSTQEDPIEPISDEAGSNTARNNRNRNESNQGRPDLPQIIAATARATADLAIFVCGPVSMLHDVRNVAAREQERILSGGERGEVYLHTERFS
jgi:ferric-chelate reductase